VVEKKNYFEITAHWWQKKNHFEVTPIGGEKKIT
jgi:hypothetical protein